VYHVGLSLSGPDNKAISHDAVSRRNGVVTVTGVNVSLKTGPNFIIAQDERGLTARSNPIVVTENPTAPGIFWGDIHVHTELCDGLGTVDEAYEYARDVAGVDFAAVATHDTLCDSRDWAKMKVSADHYNEPGRFVPFLAYEYGERKVGGDKTVLYREDNEEIYRSVDEGSRTPEELWAKLRDKKVITMPHSGAHRSMGTNWEYHDPHIQRLVEIYSEWGNSEYPGNPRPVTWGHQLEKRPARPGGTVQEGLLTGARVGIIAASDNHSGQPGYCDLMGSFARRRAYHGGLAAVYADSLTRPKIWDALWNRRCYGTTGARIILYFILNGHPMGSEIPLESLDENSRKIELSVAGTEHIQRIDIVRNNKNVFSCDGNDQVTASSSRTKNPSSRFS
jgi:hypothetical protein